MVNVSSIFDSIPAAAHRFDPRIFQFKDEIDPFTNPFDHVSNTSAPTNNGVELLTTNPLKNLIKTEFEDINNVKYYSK